MSELTPDLLRLTREDCLVRIARDGALFLTYKDTGEEAWGYEWVMEELCRRTLERTETKP